MILLAFCAQDVHDRGLFYYRLLRADPSKARAVIAGGETATDGGPPDPERARSLVAGGFAEDREVLAKDQLLAEFNTLAVVYGKSQRHFIAADKRPRNAAAAASFAERRPRAVALPAFSAPPSSAVDLSAPVPGVGSSGSEEEDIARAIAASLAEAEAEARRDQQAIAEAQAQLAAQEAAPTAGSQEAVEYGAPLDLLGTETPTSFDLLGGESPAPAPAPAPTPVAAAPLSAGLALDGGAELAPETFQELWAQWPALGGGAPLQCPGSGALGSGGAQADADAVDAFLSSAAAVHTMASGDPPDAIKLFL